MKAVIVADPGALAAMLVGKELAEIERLLTAHSKAMLNQKEASMMLGISEKTLIRYRDLGVFPKPKRIGATVLYSVQALEEFAHG